jgi:hypothetical protein
MHSLFQDFSQNLVVIVRPKGVSLAFEELVLKLNPMESDRVQEALKSIHQHQYS